MTIKDAVSSFDSSYKNTIPAELKLRWLSDLDAALLNDLILTHAAPSVTTLSPYGLDTPEDTPLLFGPPYDAIYLRYLEMQADLFYGDIARYNNHLSLYSAAYYDLEKHYHTTHLPLKRTHCFNV